MNNSQVLFEIIGQIARRRYLAAEQCFSALNLNHTEARLLSLLRQAGGAATQDALAGQLIIDRSNTGRSLKHLEQLGCILRRIQPGDKRANQVRLTRKGSKTAIAIDRFRRKMAQDFFGNLTDAEAGAVVNLLGKAFPEYLP